MKSIITAMIAICLVTACASVPMGLRHNVVVDGQSVTYVSEPAAGPTVVFESGLGDGLSSWNPVYDATSEFAGVIAYSRPGYSGFMRPTPGRPRTADDSAAFLRQLLENTHTAPPYILVGHSIGGLYMLEFARDYPDIVAGIVLVDARLPEFTDRCEQAGVSPCSPPKHAVMLAPPHIRAEVNGMRQSELNGPQPSDIGSIPTILLAATKPPPGASAAGQPVWLRVQQDFADGLADGRLEIVDGSGHYVHRDAPDRIVAAIRELVYRGIDHRSGP